MRCKGDHLSIFRAIAWPHIHIDSIHCPFPELSISQIVQEFPAQSCQQTPEEGNDVSDVLLTYAHFLLLLFLLWPHGVTAENWWFYMVQGTHAKPP